MGSVLRALFAIGDTINHENRMEKVEKGDFQRDFPPSTTCPLMHKTVSRCCDVSYVKKQKQIVHETKPELPKFDQKFKFDKVDQSCERASIAEQLHPRGMLRINFFQPYGKIRSMLRSGRRQNHKDVISYRKI